jgi:hypothetical protein
VKEPECHVPHCNQTIIPDTAFAGAAMKPRHLRLRWSRGADVPVGFDFPSLDLSGFGADLIVTFGETSQTWSLLVERCFDSAGVATGSMAWAVIPRIFTSTLPPGRQSSFELRLTEPRGTLRIAATGTINATGGLNP